MKKFSLLLTLVMLVSLFGVASPTPVAADPIPGTVIQIPVIQVGSGWETWIQVQNTGAAAGKFGLLLYGYSGPYCGPQCAAALKLEMSGLVPVGGAWTFKLDSIYTVDCNGRAFTPRSGIIVSLSAAQWTWVESLFCTPTTVICCLSRTLYVDMLWRGYATAGAPAPPPGGQPLAVSVNRIQTGAGGTPRAAAYTGISPLMENSQDPRTGAFMYYAPQLFDTYGPSGWSSTIWIQNSGIECTSLEIWFQRQQNCLKNQIQEVLALCPGETVAITPEMPGFLGSAWIRATQPLGVIVDEYLANGSILMSYRGMPANIFAGPASGSLFNFAPLIYREYNGWNTGIVVQNLSSVVNALVKVYFLDNSGDIITTIVEWICPRGSQVFYLPAIDNLYGQYVGQARIESQNWWGPGDPPVNAPAILSVVNLVNYNTGQGAAYNTFPKQEALFPRVVSVGLPFLAKDKHDPYEPAGTAWTSEIAMTNLDMLPGFSVWRIDLFDQNGLLYSICQTLNEKQVDYIRLANIGIIPQGWLGSAVITWQCSQPIGAPLGSLGVVVVERARGYVSGDLTKVYEGFPLAIAPIIPPAVACPECCQDGRIAGTVLLTAGGAAVPAGTVVQLWSTTVPAVLLQTTTTNALGAYQFINVPAGVAAPGGVAYTVIVLTPGLPTATPVFAFCGVTTIQNFGIGGPALPGGVVPPPVGININGTATLSPSGAPLVGNTMQLWNAAGTTMIGSTTANAAGAFVFTALPGTYQVRLIWVCGAAPVTSADAAAPYLVPGTIYFRSVHADPATCVVTWTTP